MVPNVTVILPNKWNFNTCTSIRTTKFEFAINKKQDQKSHIV